MIKVKETGYNQNGNIFIIILAAIFLFGALIYTFSRGANKGADNLTSHQSRIAAQEIINHAQSISQAVNRVRRNGCSENEINFNDIALTGYNNTNAPSDNSCHIFHNDGGKASYTSPEETWLNNTLQEWDFNASFAVQNIETTCSDDSCSDLALHLPHVKQTICEHINKQLNINDGAIINDSDYTQTNFTGSFTTPAIIGDEASSADLSGKETGCFYSINDATHVFYHILLAR